jgi:CspA family cold shock protein
VLWSMIASSKGCLEPRLAPIHESTPKFLSLRKGRRFPLMGWPGQIPPRCCDSAAGVRHRNTAVYNSVIALATKSTIRITSPKIVTWEIEMARGTVKWFNPTKGYGFIQPQAGGKDLFVHISAVERAGLSTLNEGQHLEYEIEENRGKTSAVNLKVK